MRFEAKHMRLFIDGVIQPAGTHGVLIRTDTGAKIPYARFADTETGKWEAWAAWPNGEMENPPRLLKGRCPIEFKLSHAAVLKSRVPTAHQFPTELDKAKTKAEVRQIAKDWGFTELIQVPGIECEYPGCHKMAMFQTGDEQIIEPAPGGFERAFTKRVHKYCGNRTHWRAPVRTSMRGVEEEAETDVRPE